MDAAGETATFVVGGETHQVPPLTIFALRKCWDDIVDVGKADNTMLQSISSMLKIVSAGLSLTKPEVTLDYLEQRCIPGDVASLNTGIVTLLRISGMATVEAGATGEAPTSSMETGTDSSLSLSPTV